MKTARLAEVVKQAGAPNAYQLWADPKKDRTFQRAVAEHRVLTVHQENIGTKKDYGLVGFREEPHAQYLIFPRSVKGFTNRRIIGINYRLLAKESRLESRPAARQPKRRAASKKPIREKPEEKVIAFTPPPREPAPEKPETSEPKIDPRFIAEVTKAMQELRAGKAVPAYERLAALVEQARG
jgi:hypothetical protein